MIIWRGKGLLVFLSMLIGGSTGGTMVNLVLKDGITSTSTRYLYAFIMMIFTAGANYVITKLFVPNQEQVVVDEETGEKVTYRNRSSLFFIPNRYWTWIFVAFWILFAFTFNP